MDMRGFSHGNPVIQVTDTARSGISSPRKTDIGIIFDFRSRTRTAATFRRREKSPPLHTIARHWAHPGQCGIRPIDLSRQKDTWSEGGVRVAETADRRENPTNDHNNGESCKKAHRAISPTG